MRFMDNEPEIGITEPARTAADIAVERWYNFMFWPGFGWIGCLAPLRVHGILGWAIVYMVLYAAFAWSHPHTFSRFWSDAGVRVPQKLQDVLASAIAFVMALPGRIKRAFEVAKQFVIGAWALAHKKRDPLGHFLMMGLGGPVVSSTQSAKAPPESAAAAVKTLAAVAVPQNSEVREDPSPPREPIDWAKLAAKLLNPKAWAIIGVCVVILTLAQCFGGGFHNPLEPSGAVVAARANENQARAEVRTGHAEANQRASATERVEHRTEVLDHIRHDTEAFHASITAAPDLAARFELHRTFCQRMRDNAASARAAALQDYRASIGTSPSGAPAPT